MNLFLVMLVVGAFIFIVSVEKTNTIYATFPKHISRAKAQLEHCRKLVDRYEAMDDEDDYKPTFKQIVSLSVKDLKNTQEELQAKLSLFDHYRHYQTVGLVLSFIGLFGNAFFG